MESMRGNHRYYYVDGDNLIVIYTYIGQLL